MLSLKKYFTEGLIQVAILLSLCGVKVDVGLESFLPPSLHDMILSPTSLLTQTQFHNHRNRLEDGQGLHPKSVDQDVYFGTQSLLRWLRSPDRLQIPQQEVATWLVQQEPEPLFPEQTQSHMSRGAAAAEREQSLREAEDHNGVEEETCEESVSEDEDQAGGDRGESAVVHRESNQQEFNQTSLQECLRLLEVTFPFSEELQFRDPEGDVPRGPAERNHTRLIHTDSSTSELDLQWQDLLTILTPQCSSFGLDSGDGSAARSDQLVSGEEAPGPQGVEHELQPGLLPLVPSAELDDHNSTHDRQHSALIGTHTPPDLVGLLSEDLGLSAEDSFDMTLLPGELDESMECCSRSGPDPAATSSSSSSPSNGFADEQDVEDEAEFDELLQDADILDEMGFLDLALEDSPCPERKDNTATQEERMAPQQEAENEEDSDSGLSLDFSNSPSSPCTSSCISSSCSSSSSLSPAGGTLSDGDGGCEEGFDSPAMEVEVAIKQEEEEEEIGAVGGEYPEDIKFFSPNFGDNKILTPCLNQWISHDHTYNQHLSPTSPIKPSRSSRPHVDSKSCQRPLSRRLSDMEMWSRDERRARALKIPFSNELIVHLPVEEFNELLAEYQLTEDQLTMVRDIRRRGKNKVAAQNCRQRKLGVLQGLEGEVSALRHHRLQLLRERQEALRNLQDMKRELATLYWEVFSSLRDEEGKPLDSSEYQIHVGPDGTVKVDSYTHEVKRSMGCRKANKKRREKTM